MTVYSTTDVAGLNRALAQAQTGDRIEIGDGALLRDVSISNRHYAGSGITIASAKGGAGGFENLSVSRSSGITFDDVTFSRILADGGQTFLNAASFTSVDRVGVFNSRVHSSLDGQYGNDSDGLEFQHATNIDVSANDFTQIRKGLIIINADQVTVRDNVIHDLGGDALNFVNVRDAQITGNSAYGWGQIGDFHRDFIQFWTDPRYAASSDVTISRNVLISPDAAVQGIFVESDTNQGFYDFDINNNLIVTLSSHGIVGSPVSDSVIANNTVLGAGGNRSAGRIAVFGEEDFRDNLPRNVVVRDNVSMGAIGLDPAGVGLSASGNVALQVTLPDAPLYVDALVLDALGGHELNDFRFRPDAGLPAGVGAVDLFGAVSPPPAYIAHSQASAVEDVLTASFEAVDWDGHIALGTSYVWRFEDGGVAFGASVEHRFAQMGMQDVQLTTYALGQMPVTVDKTVLIGDPRLLAFDFEAGAQAGAGASTIPDTSPYGHDGVWKAGAGARAAGPAYANGDDGEGRALLLDGAATKATINVPGLQLDARPELTVSLDINPATLASSRIVWEGSVFGLELQSSGKLSVHAWTGDGVAKVLTSNAAITANDWHSIVVRYDGDGGTGGSGALSLFIDGGLDSTLNGLGQNLAQGSSAPLQIGSGVNARYFSGSIDNVRFYAGAYDPSEIRQVEAIVNAEVHSWMTGQNFADRTNVPFPSLLPPEAGSEIGTLSFANGMTYAGHDDGSPLHHWQQMSLGWDGMA